MAEEKLRSAGTATMDAPGENTVEVVFMPEGKTVQFEHGKLPYKDHGKEESLLDVALNNGIRLDHACGGNCACTTCHIWVKEGAENLSEMDDDEADRRRHLAADLQPQFPPPDARPSSASEVKLWLRFRRGIGITCRKNTREAWIQHSAVSQCGFC